MKKLSINDEKSLEKQLALQLHLAWDIEKDIAWQVGLDIYKPLVPLDFYSLSRFKASNEESLVLSQVMGLIIAASTCEMEDFLLEVKKESFDNLVKKIPVSKSFIDLGEQFYVEEKKHSTAFRMYMEKFAEKLNIDPKDLYSILPCVKGTKSELILRQNLRTNGMCFWWIVANVEQEFLSIFKSITSIKNEVDPLYFDVHQKHYEEEARHISFPFMVLDLLKEKNPSILKKFHVKLDWAAAQILQMSWTFASLRNLEKVKDLKDNHFFFNILNRSMQKLNQEPKVKLGWHFLTRAAYVGSLANTQSKKHLEKIAKEHGSFNIPLPKFNREKLVG